MPDRFEHPLEGNRHTNLHLTDDQSSQQAGGALA